MMTNITGNSGYTVQFIATLVMPISNVTGDGTVYVPAFDTVAGTGYSLITQMFTADSAGDYLFLCDIDFGGITSSHTACINELVSNLGNYRFGQMNLATGRSSANNFFLPQGVVPIRMSIGDTASLTTQVSNGTKVISLGNKSQFSALRFL